jgi:hypothetical protein
MLTGENLERPTKEADIVLWGRLESRAVTR